MKKHFLIMIVLLTVLNSCSLFWSETNELEINGKVKKVTKIRCRIKQDSLNNQVNDTAMVEITYLNIKGQLKKRINKLYINNKISKTGLTTYLYDEQDILITEYYESEEDSVKLQVNYSYKDLLLDKTYSKIFDESYRTDYSENYYYHGNNKLKHRVMKYTEIDTISMDTTYSQIAEFKYDKNGHLISSDWENSPNDYNKMYTFINDKQGYRTKEISIDKLSKSTDTTYFEYEFDRNDNWIKTKSLRNNKLVEITNRIIEYK